MNQLDYRHHQPDGGLQWPGDNYGNFTIEADAQRFGQYLGVLYHQYREDKGKDPNPSARKQVAEGRPGKGCPDSMGSGIQNQNYGNWLFNIIFERLTNKGLFPVGNFLSLKLNYSCFRPFFVNKVNILLSKRF